MHLRGLVPGDEDFLVSLDTDPVVMEHAGGTMEERQARKFAQVLVEGQQYRWRSGRWMVLLKESGVRVGWMELAKLSLPQSDELQVGYQFAPAHWETGTRRSRSRC